jgi:hypothetical protein
LKDVSRSTTKSSPAASRCFPVMERENPGRASPLEEIRALPRERATLDEKSGRFALRRPIGGTRRRPGGADEISAKARPKGLK